MLPASERIAVTTALSEAFPLMTRRVFERITFHSSREISTATSDKYWRVFINPIWWGKLDSPMRVRAATNEAFHCLYSAYRHAPSLPFPLVFDGEINSEVSAEE